MILLVLNLFKINFAHWASSVKILIQNLNKNFNWWCTVGEINFK